MFDRVKEQVFLIRKSDRFFGLERFAFEMEESSSNRSGYRSQPSSGNDEAPPEVSEESRHSFVLLSSSNGDAETSADSASVHGVENRGRHQFVPCSEHKNVAQLLVSTSPNLDAPDSFDSTVSSSNLSRSLTWSLHTNSSLFPFPKALFFSGIAFICKALLSWIL